MVPPPLILISASTEKKGVEFGDTSFSLSQNYPRAVSLGGGVPVILAGAADRKSIAATERRCDGVVLSGGDDINPQLYSRKIPAQLRKTLGPLDRARDLRELLLLEEVFRQRKPLLAICRGHQLLNVALGGTLLVDIARQKPDALNHDRSDRPQSLVHEVQLTRNSLLAKMTGLRRLGVNSSHHQAVDRVADGLQVSAWSADGVVEALELAERAAAWLPFLLAVQFHPERLAAAHHAHRNIFTGFVAACRRESCKNL